MRYVIELNAPLTDLTATRGFITVNLILCHALLTNYFSATPVSATVTINLACALACPFLSFLVCNQDAFWLHVGSWAVVLVAIGIKFCWFPENLEKNKSNALLFAVVGDLFKYVSRGHSVAWYRRNKYITGFIIERATLSLTEDSFVVSAERTNFPSDSHKRVIVAPNLLNPGVP